MEVFVSRDPAGYQTFEMESLEDLEETLKQNQAHEPLRDNEEVHVTIDATWSEIKELLSLPFFEEKKIWQFHLKHLPG